MTPLILYSVVGLWTSSHYDVAAASTGSQLPDRGCQVVRAALRAAVGTADSLPILRQPVGPWPGFRDLPPDRQTSLLNRAHATLHDPDSLLQRLMATHVRPASLPECTALINGTSWVSTAPSQPTDTTLVTLSTPVFSGDGHWALIYVGQSNRWVGHGDIYLLALDGRTWHVARQVFAWIQ